MYCTFNFKQKGIKTKHLNNVFNAFVIYKKRNCDYNNVMLMYIYFIIIII